VHTRPPSAALPAAVASCQCSTASELPQNAFKQAISLPLLPLQVGLGVAVDYCLAVGVEFIWRRVQHLAHILRAGLVALPGVRVWDHGRVLCGIVSFTKVGGLLLVPLRWPLTGVPLAN
jgi:hypothetical protein